jgi:uncharacterized protein YndB with AHSA1/START domain
MYYARMTSTAPAPTTPAAPFVVAVSVDTTASPESVWRLWSDVASWPTWDGALDHARLDGPFVPGTTGAMAVHGQGELAFALTAVDPGRGFADETPIPGGQVRLTHELEVLGGDLVRVTHRAEIAGLPEVARAIANQIRQGLGPAVAALVGTAEETTA